MNNMVRTLCMYRKNVRGKKGSSYYAYFKPRVKPALTAMISTSGKANVAALIRVKSHDLFLAIMPEWQIHFDFGPKKMIGKNKETSRKRYKLTQSAGVYYGAQLYVCNSRHSNCKRKKLYIIQCAL